MPASTEMTTYRIRDSLDGVTIWETYFIKGVNGGDAADAMSDLPKKGTPSTRPGYERAIVVDVDLVDWLDSTQVFATVRYDSNRFYSGGARRRGGGFARDGSVWLPLVRAVAGTTPTQYTMTDHYVDRKVLTRIEPRYMANDLATINGVHAAVATRLGNLFALGGIVYMLDDYRVDDDGQTQARVEYHFQAWAPMRGGSATANPYGCDVAVPNLGYLEKWKYVPGATATDAPQIVAVPATAALFTSPPTDLPGLVPFV